MEILDITEDTSDSYFSDGVRKVYYVLVISRISAYEHHKVLNTYIRNLQTSGLQFEQCYGITEPVVFVKIHIPEETLTFISVKYPYWKATMVVLGARRHVREWKFMKKFSTPLDFRNSLAGEDVCGRIYFINEILKYTRYGEKNEDRGLSKLLDKKIISKAYPLHDGRIQKELWNYESLMNDRTLLVKYWGNFRMFYKSQPLDMIKKYFGLELAFYFAWLGFYQKYLTPMVIISIMFILYNILRYLSRSEFLNSVCRGSAPGLPLCGYCVLEDKKCYMTTVDQYCPSIHLQSLSENESYIYAMVMSIWAGLVASQWKRYEAKLRKRWNLTDIEHQLDERFQYRKNQRNRRKSFLTGRMEAYTPTLEKFVVLIVTYLVISLVGVALLLSMYLNISFTNHMKILLIRYRQASAASLELLFDSLVIIIQFTIVRIAWSWLTKLCSLIVRLQHHKYQQEHDKTFLFLRYACAFMNQYMIFFYIAFIKGSFYNIPNPEVTLDYLSYEKCPVSSCMDVLLVMVNIVAILFALGKCKDYFASKLKVSSGSGGFVLPQHEREYKLEQVKLWHLQVQFIQNMILHGFLVFFATGNFFGAIFAMYITIARLRVDAFNFLHNYQRPVPKIVYNVNPWNNVLMFITVASMLLNALVSMFTSEAIDMQYYLHSHRNMTGYFIARLSVFDKRDLFGPEFSDGSGNNSHLCYYRDQRYPPDHPNKYRYTVEFWMLTNWKLIGIYLFEMLVITMVSLMHIGRGYEPVRGSDLHINYRFFRQQQEKYKWKDKKLFMVTPFDEE